MSRQILSFVVTILAFVAGGAVVFLAVQPNRPQLKNEQQLSQPRTETTDEASVETAELPAHAQPASNDILPEEINDVIDLLRSNFLDAPDLLGRAVTPETLPSILKKLGRKVLIQPAPDFSERLLMKSELLPHNIAYWRVPGFSHEGIERLIQSWRDWDKISGLIIDLRSFQAPNDFAGAADLAGFFVPPGTTIFSMQGIKVPQRIFQTERQLLMVAERFPIIVLVNEATCGAGEVLAGVLRDKAGALILGETTAGEAAVYSEHELPSGRILKLATAEILTPAGETWLGKIIEPDVPVKIDTGEEALAMAYGYEHGFAKTIQEIIPPPRLSESSLEKRGADELDAMIEAEKEEEEEVADIPYNIALHRASDIIQGLSTALSQPAVSTADTTP